MRIFEFILKLWANLALVAVFGTMIAVNVGMAAHTIRSIKRRKEVYGNK